jgi:hypothetical protein
MQTRAAGKMGNFDQIFGPVLAKLAEAAKVVYKKRAPTVELIDIPPFDPSTWPQIVEELKRVMA